MTYEATEEGIYTGAPVELYTFTKGASTWSYTSGDSYGGYTSVSIQRSDLAQDNEDNSGGCEITLPASDAVAKLWSAQVSADPLWLTISRLHRVDLSPITYFIGRCTNIRIGDVEATLTFQSLKQSWRRKIPTQIASTTCRHMLYGSACGLSEASHRYSATVSSVSGSAVTLSGSYTAGILVGGVLTYGNEKRLIISQTGASSNIVTLLNALALTGGESVTVTKGCDRSLSTCGTKFSNAVNFGGLTVHTPEGSNPFQRGIY